MFGDARSDEIHYVINDLLAVESFEYSIDEAKFLAAANFGPSLSNPNVRSAFVTTDRSISALIAHVSSISSYEVSVFLTLEEARDWIETSVPLHQFRRIK